MEHQDWNVMTINKNQKKSNQTNNENVLTQRKTEKVNRQRKAQNNQSKIEKSDGVEHIKTVSKDISCRIRDARVSKKMTQKELANKINEQQIVISEYESGKALPNQQILGKLERVLGVKLRGKLN